MPCALPRAPIDKSATPTGIDHNCRSNKIHRTLGTADRAIGDCALAGRCLWFIAKNCDDGRRVNNHFGNPQSS